MYVYMCVIVIVSKSITLYGRKINYYSLVNYYFLLFNVIVKGEIIRGHESECVAINISYCVKTVNVCK